MRFQEFSLTSKVLNLSLSPKRLNNLVDGCVMDIDIQGS
jgi:hypothetical protein